MIVTQSTAPKTTPSWQDRARRAVIELKPNQVVLKEDKAIPRLELKTATIDRVMERIEDACFVFFTNVANALKRKVSDNALRRAARSLQYHTTWHIGKELASNSNSRWELLEPPANTYVPVGYLRSRTGATKPHIDTRSGLRVISNGYSPVKEMLDPGVLTIWNLEDHKTSNILRGDSLWLVKQRLDELDSFIPEGQVPDEYPICVLIDGLSASAHSADNVKKEPYKKSKRIVAFVDMMCYPDGRKRARWDEKEFHKYVGDKQLSHKLGKNRNLFITGKKTGF